MSRRYKIVDKSKSLIDWSLKVRLPNGSTNSVNVFDYNLASVCHQADPEKRITVQLDDGAWIQVGNLTPIFTDEAEEAKGR